MNDEMDLNSHQPELEELLQKPNSLPLVGDRRKQGTIIPSSTSREKSCPTPATENGKPDVVIAAIGEYGRWQLLITFLLSLFSFPCTIHIYLPTFTSKETKFWCRRPDNLSAIPIQEWINYSQPQDACSIRVLSSDITVESILNHTAPLIDAFQKCTEWEFDRSEIGETIISEWELVCDRAGLTNLAEMIFLVGVGIGGVAGGMISDKFGRKRVLMGMTIAQSALAILSLLVQSYTQYVLVRLVMGLVSVSVVYAAFVLVVELVGGKWVTIAGVCNFFPLPLSYVIVSLISWVLPNWRDLQLTVSLPGCLLILLCFVLPESPQWLLSMGRIKEAKAILQKAAKMNKRELPADLDKMILVSREDTKHEEPSVMMLFKGYLLKRTVCLFMVWFAITIAYYGLVLNIGKMKIGNLHMTSIILAAVEIPAVAISIPILLKAGRRIPIFISMIVCGLACVASELLSMSFTNDWITTVCLMIGKFAIATSNMMMPIFTAELYPTVVRNLGVGASQLSAGIALMCIPYLWQLEPVNEHLPMLMLALMSAFGGSIVLLLPDIMRCKEQTFIPDSKTSALDSTSNGTFSAVDDRGQ